MILSPEDINQIHVPYDSYCKIQFRNQKEHIDLALYLNTAAVKYSSLQTISRSLKMAVWFQSRKLLAYYQTSLQSVVVTRNVQRI